MTRAAWMFWKKEEVKVRVWIKSEDVSDSSLSVKVDPFLKTTLVSVTPTFDARLFGDGSCSAK